MVFVLLPPYTRATGPQPEQSRELIHVPSPLLPVTDLKVSAPVPPDAPPPFPRGCAIALAIISSGAFLTGGLWAHFVEEGIQKGRIADLEIRLAHVEKRLADSENPPALLEPASKQSKVCDRICLASTRFREARNNADKLQKVREHFGRASPDDFKLWRLLIGIQQYQSFITLLRTIDEEKDFRQQDGLSGVRQALDYAGFSESEIKDIELGPFDGKTHWGWDSLSMQTQHTTPPDDILELLSGKKDMHFRTSF